MKTSQTRILGGTILAAVTALSLAACSYHERTVVERPVAVAPGTVIVPETRSNTIVVPEGSSAVIVPNNN
jgi:hypothetical protein